jgi:dienelactone hydrolase
MLGCNFREPARSLGWRVLFAAMCLWAEAGCRAIVPAGVFGCQVDGDCPNGQACYDALCLAEPPHQTGSFDGANVMSMAGNAGPTAATSGNAAVAGMQSMAGAVSGAGGMAGSARADEPAAPAAAGSGNASGNNAAGSSGVLAAGSGNAPAAGAGTAAGSGSAGTAGAAAGSNGAAAGQAAPARNGPTEESVRQPGPFSVQMYGEDKGLRNGPDYGDAGMMGGGADLYYPEGAPAPLSGIVIIGAYPSPRASVAGWGMFLASHGIVSMVIDPNSASDQPEARSLALIDAVTSLRAEQTRAGSPLQGKLDAQRIGILGWSMGGGGVWIAADSHPELKVAISLCGWNGSAKAGAMTRVPSLMIAAADDALAAGMSTPVYNAIPSGVPKMLVEFSTGSTQVGSMPANADYQVGRYVLVWIKVQLVGDESYRPLLKTMPTGTKSFLTSP